MPKPVRVVLVTTNHPYTHTGGEVMFVAPELPRLLREFGAVSLVPQHAGGTRLQVPQGAEVDLTLARRWRSFGWLGYLQAPFWPGFWGELGRAVRHGGVTGCLRVWRWAAHAQITWQWARNRLPCQGALLLYTYWRGGSTLAFARYAEQRADCAVVTRVHGYDLYEDRFRPPFQPWISVYHALDLTLPISDHGQTHLRGQGVPPSRLWRARLGVEGAASRARASVGAEWRLVSCSVMVPLKRVPQIAAAIAALARRHPGHAITWTHFGDGPDRDAVQAVLRAAPSNLRAVLRGRVPNDVVRAHYANEPVDLFVLLSESEGLPVSIQEAASAGIPILATDVGGVGEIVGADNGRLVPVDASANEVAMAIETLLMNSAFDAREARRKASHARWAADFDAERNHSRLARRLRELTDTL